MFSFTTLSRNHSAPALLGVSRGVLAEAEQGFVSGVTGDKVQWGAEVGQPEDRMGASFLAALTDSLQDKGNDDRPSIGDSTPATRKLPSWLNDRLEPSMKSARLVQERKEAHLKDVSRDLKVRLNEAATDSSKAAHFVMWLMGDDDTPGASATPQQALQTVFTDQDSARLMFSVRQNAMGCPGGLGLEAALLNTVSANPSLAAGQMNALAANLSSGPCLAYLQSVSNNPNLSIGYVGVQASAVGSSGGRSALTSYYGALASQPAAAAMDLNIQANASGSDGGRQSLETLHGAMAQDSGLASAAVGAQAAARLGRRAEPVASAGSGVAPGAAKGNTLASGLLSGST